MLLLLSAVVACAAALPLQQREFVGAYGDGIADLKVFFVDGCQRVAAWNFVARDAAEVAHENPIPKTYDTVFVDYPQQDGSTRTFQVPCVPRNDANLNNQLTSVVNSPNVQALNPGLGLVSDDSCLMQLFDSDCHFYFDKFRDEHYLPDDSAQPKWDPVTFRLARETHMDDAGVVHNNQTFWLRGVDEPPYDPAGACYSLQALGHPQGVGGFRLDFKKLRSSEISRHVRDHHVNLTLFDADDNVIDTDYWVADAAHMKFRALQGQPPIASRVYTDLPERTDHVLMLTETEGFTGSCVVMVVVDVDTPPPHFEVSVAEALTPTDETVLQWTQSDNEGGDMPTSGHLLLHRQGDDDDQWTSLPLPAFTANNSLGGNITLPIADYGLAIGTQYSVKMRLVNAHGERQSWNTATLRVGRAPAFVPEVTFDVIDVYSNEHAKVVVRWRPLSGHNETGAGNTSVSYKFENTPKGTVTTTSNREEFVAPLDELLQMEMTATNAMGYSISATRSTLVRLLPSDLRPKEPQFQVHQGQPDELIVLIAHHPGVDAYDVTVWPQRGEPVPIRSLRVLANASSTAFLPVHLPTLPNVQVIVQVSARRQDNASPPVSHPSLHVLPTPELPHLDGRLHFEAGHVALHGTLQYVAHEWTQVVDVLVMVVHPDGREERLPPLTTTERVVAHTLGVNDFLDAQFFVTVRQRNLHFNSEWSQWQLIHEDGMAGAAAGDKVVESSGGGTPGWATALLVVFALLLVAGLVALMVAKRKNQKVLFGDGVQMSTEPEYDEDGVTLSSASPNVVTVV